jgi:hypothetical protein
LKELLAALTGEDGGGDEKSRRGARKSVGCRYGQMEINDGSFSLSPLLLGKVRNNVSKETAFPRSKE